MTGAAGSSSASLIATSDAVARSGIAKQDIGFTCSGSSDYIAGQAFAFVGAVDGLGAWPPIMESHVEMDGAWALYEGWLKIQMGYAESALVFGFGRASMGDLPETLNLQLDYPELSRIPWELATRNQLPFQHLLLDGVSIVRKVPALVQDDDAQWPTGRNRALRLLYV